MVLVILCRSVVANLFLIVQVAFELIKMAVVLFTETWKENDVL
jgi:hypothetical protein